VSRGAQRDLVRYECSSKDHVLCNTADSNNSRSLLDTFVADDSVSMCCRHEMLLCKPCFFKACMFMVTCDL
jgi:hypothetical protein